MPSKYSMVTIYDIFNIYIEKDNNKFIKLLYEYITFHFVE